jgi:hypothetical protein
VLSGEARLAKIDLKPEEHPKIDPNFEEMTEDTKESVSSSAAFSENTGITT